MHQPTDSRAQWETSKILGNICLAALMVALVNAPFWLLQQSHYVIRALINLDLIIALVIFARFRGLGLAVLLGLWLIDGLITVSNAFHFPNPLEFIATGKYVRALDFNGDYLLSLAVLALPFPLALAGVVVVSKRTRIAPATYAVLAVLLCAVDIYGNANSLSSLFKQDNMVGLPFNATTSRLYKLSKFSTTEARTPPAAVLPPGSSVTGKLDIPQWMALNPTRSVLLVIVESFGVPTDPAKRTWLEQKLASPRFRPEAVDLPFSGSTVAGELRTLCNIEGSVQSLPPHVSGCLPQRLRQQQVRTLAFHGFARDMFDRGRWWPSIGLDEVHFGDDASMRGSKRCGSVFQGVCDADMIGLAVEKLRARRGFAYVLTLNTHLPVQKWGSGERSDPALQRICAAGGTTEEVCRILHMQGQILADTVALAGAMEPAPLVVLIGDHAPPFANLASRREFVEGRVPAYILHPR